jgi:hypothetical protein
MSVAATEHDAIRNPSAAERAKKIRDVSTAVYAKRLDQECKGNSERMLAQDNDGGAKMRGRAAAYDSLTRAYLDVLGVAI